jgi:hypothetical protein
VNVVYVEPDSSKGIQPKGTKASSVFTTITQYVNAVYIFEQGRSDSSFFELRHGYSVLVLMCFVHLNDGSCDFEMQANGGGSLQCDRAEHKLFHYSGSSWTYSLVTNHTISIRISVNACYQTMSYYWLSGCFGVLEARH